MLEHDGRLWTWALARLPRAWHDRLTDNVVAQSATQRRDTDAREPIIAERLADHRIEYLDYEGPVSRDRGSVHRCCRGTYQVIEATADRVVVQLESPLSGSLLLERLATDEARWSLLWDKP
jgi:hypothetical protein